MCNCYKTNVGERHVALIHSPWRKFKLLRVMDTMYKIDGLPPWLVVKNSPTMQKTQEMWVWSLGWEDTLEKGMATHSSIFAWRIPGQRSLVGYNPFSCKKSDRTTTLTLSLNRASFIQGRKHTQNSSFQQECH